MNHYMIIAVCNILAMVKIVAKLDAIMVPKYRVGKDCIITAPILNLLFL